MAELYEEGIGSGYGLQVDGKNAFKAVNRVTALWWNACILCPKCSCFLFNTLPY